MPLKRNSVPSLLPRDLSAPYISLAQKESDWERLLLRTVILGELTALADVPEDQWPRSAAVESLLAAPPITTETASQRLDRWRNVFADELSDLERAVSAASRQGGYSNLADIDLRTAVYLAGRLLATLYGVSVSEIRP
jgi:hypothetical protein